VVDLRQAWVVRAKGHRRAVALGLKLDQRVLGGAAIPIAASTCWPTRAEGTMPPHCGARCETQALIRSSLAAATAGGPSATTRGTTAAASCGWYMPGGNRLESRQSAMLQVTVQFELRYLNGADVSLKPDHRPIGCRDLAARDRHRKIRRMDAAWIERAVARAFAQEDAESALLAS
jgi:hypothetical protein